VFSAPVHRSRRGEKARRPLPVRHSLLAATVKYPRVAQDSLLIGEPPMQGWCPRRYRRKDRGRDRRAPSCSI